MRTTKPRLYDQYLHGPGSYWAAARFIRWRNGRGKTFILDASSIAGILVPSGELVAVNRGDDVVEVVDSLAESYGAANLAIATTTG